MYIKKKEKDRDCAQLLSLSSLTLSHHRDAKIHRRKKVGEHTEYCELAAWVNGRKEEESEQRAAISRAKVARRTRIPKVSRENEDLAGLQRAREITSPGESTLRHLVRYGNLIGNESDRHV